MTKVHQAPSLKTGGITLRVFRNHETYAREFTISAEHFIRQAIHKCGRATAVFMPQSVNPDDDRNTLD